MAAVATPAPSTEFLGVSIEAIAITSTDAVVISDALDVATSSSVAKDVAKEKEVMEPVARDVVMCDWARNLA